MGSAKLSDWIAYGRNYVKRWDDRKTQLHWLNDARARWHAL